MHPAHIASLLLLVSCVGAAELAPAPYPAGPLLTVTIPDVPRLRERLSASWYGRLWTTPDSAPLRERLDNMLATALNRTGIDLARLGRGIQRIDGEARGAGDLSRVRMELTEPATAVLADVDAAIAREEKNPTANGKITTATTENGEAIQLTALGPRLVQRTSDGVVLYRSRRKPGEDPATDGLLFHAERNVLTLATDPFVGAPALTATPAAAETDLGLDLNLGMLANALGIPGLADFFALAGTTHGVLDLRLNGESSEELVRLAGAHLPLKAVDFATLEAEVPGSALSLSAFGIDGPLLATLMTRLAERRPDLGFTMAELAPALRGLDGTAWMAMLSGTPFPDLALGIPADAAVDAWLTRALHASPELMREARTRPVTIPSPTGWHFTLAARRLERSWLLATDAKALEQLGNPGLAERLATRQNIPPGAVGLCVQASEPLLRMLARYALLGQLALATETAAEDVPRTIRTGNQPDPPPHWTRSQLADLRMLASVAARVGSAATAPPAVGWLLATADGMDLHGRNLALGVTTLPMNLTVYLGLLPVTVPDWTVANHAVVAAGLTATAMPWAGAETSGTLGRLLLQAAYPGDLAQLRTLALGSPSPDGRRMAGEYLAWATWDNPERRREAEPVWVAMMDDARPEPQVGALTALAWMPRDQPLAAPILAAVLKGCSRADRATRTAAFHIIALHSESFRLAQRAAATGNRGGTPQPPPPAALEPLLAHVGGQDVGSLSEVCVALAGFDDSRVVPALVPLLAHAEPIVRALAAKALCLMPQAANDPATLTAVAALREDQTVADGDTSTVGEAMLYSLLTVPGDLATGLLGRELTRPIPAANTPMQSYLREQTIRVLLRRGYAPALDTVASLLTQTPPLTDNRRVSLAKALGACPLPGAIPFLQSLLLSRSKPVAGAAADGLLTHARLQALDVATITALLAACTHEDANARSAARRVLDRLKLSKEQAVKLRAAVDEARRAFASNAFPDYKPPTPEEKPGADDF